MHARIRMQSFNDAVAHLESNNSWNFSNINIFLGLVSFVDTLVAIFIGTRIHSFIGFLQLV